MSGYRRGNNMTGRSDNTTNEYIQESFSISGTDVGSWFGFQLMRKCEQMADMGTIPD